MAGKSKRRPRSRFWGLVVKAVRESDMSAFRWRNLDKTKILVPFRMLLHPVDACSDIKYEGRGSLALANGMALLFFVLSVVKAVAYGFIFNEGSDAPFNVWPVFLQSLGLLLLWTLSSWSLSTLLDGEGKLREIWTTLCYCTLPYILLIPVAVLLSHVLTAEESYFILLIEAVMGLWTLLLLFASTMVVQQYTVKKTVFIMLLSAAGILAVMFLAILFFSLFQQLFIFLDTVYKEWMFRG